jgi:hypothetical protein
MKEEDVEFECWHLSLHFEVPIPKWEILPVEKSPINPTTMKKIFGPILGDHVTWKDEMYAQGSFQTLPSPHIEFYGEPDLETVYHEFMHYLVYCTQNKIRDDHSGNKIRRSRKR